MATARAKTGPRRDSAGASAMATPRARTGPRRDSASASTMATPAARTSFGPAGDLDAVTRRRVRDLRLGKTHEAAEHEGRRCPPLWVAPTARYFWLPESLGGGSSLALQHEERPACMNDLVLDLVMVYVISNIVAQGDAIVERERNINVTLSQTLLSPSSDEHINPPQFLAFKTMIEMLIIYVPIYFHWWSLSRTENAFGRDDVVHTCKWVVNMLLLVQLAGWLQVCREEQICGNYAGWMSAGKFFHVICLQYYRAYNHAHHSFQLHEESLYGGFVACGWMTLSFAMPVDASSDETLAWIHAALLSLAVLDLLRFADLLPFNSMRSVFGMCANVCSSRSRRCVIDGIFVYFMIVLSKLRGTHCEDFLSDLYASPFLFCLVLFWIGFFLAHQYLQDTRR